MHLSHNILFPPPAAPTAPVAHPTQSLCATIPLQTRTGPQAAGTLKAGQQIRTRDNTFATITQVERTHLTRLELHDAPASAPIRFEPGALPGMENSAAVLLSPDCIIFWIDTVAEAGLNIGPAAIMPRFPAKAFCDGGLIRRVIPDDGITYVRLHFDAAHQICTGGLCVSFAPEGDAILEEASLAPPKLVHEIRIFRPIAG